MWPRGQMLSFGGPPQPAGYHMLPLPAYLNKIILNGFVEFDKILKEFKLHKYIAAAEYKL